MTATMRDRSEIEDARRAELYSSGSLGVFTAIAIIGLLWGFCWLKSFSPFSNPQRINVVFHEVAGLSENAGVYVDGVRIGMVENIKWQRERRVVVKLRMCTSDVTVPGGSQFTILSNGIVGAKFVEITLPRLASGETSPPPLPNDSEVTGEDPVRPELAVNNLAVGLSKINMEELERDFKSDRARLRRAADEMSVLAHKSMPVIDRALPLETEVIALSKDMRVVTKRLAHFMNNPKMSSDLKETMIQAKATMDTVQATMHELNVTIGDKGIRKDLVEAIDKLNTATGHIQASAETVQQITGDKELRTDVKQILKEARSAMSKVDDLFRNPEYGTDLRQTLTKTRDAVDHVDSVAKQLSQILDKRHPLIHMLVGRPGHLDKSKTAEPTAKSSASESKNTASESKKDDSSSKTAESEPRNADTDSQTAETDSKEKGADSKMMSESTDIIRK